MELKDKFRAAMAVYAVIGGAEAFLLSGRIRIAALLVVGLFAFLSWTHYSRERLESAAGRSKD
jgi:uncharacterized membrane protein